MLNFFKTILLLAVLSNLFACKGKQGDPGPQGPKGDAGPSAVSWTFSVNASDLIGPLSDYSYEASVIPPSKVYIEENDALLIYYRNTYISGVPEYTALPTDIFITNTSQFVNFSYKIYSSIFSIKVRNSSAGQPFSNMNSAVMDFRAVLIKGSKVQRSSLSEIDLRNYNEVKEYFNLND